LLASTDSYGSGYVGTEPYGVLKGRAIGRRFGRGRKPHYQIHLFAGDDDFRVAVNIGSDSQPADLLYLVDDQFQHPITCLLDDLSPGFTQLDRRPGGTALDYIRGGLFEPARLRVLPAALPGPDNDLNEQLDRHIQRVMADEEAWAYAFGSRWGPERQRDDYFGFRPGNGIHNVHMNQGNNDRHRDEDGTWQDGGLVLQFPVSGRWIGVFLAFQSQSWHTDDRTGHHCGRGVRDTPAPRHAASTSVPPVRPPTAPRTEPAVRIVAALVNALDSPETETVTLLNIAPKVVDLTGWALLDRHQGRHNLEGTLAPGATLLVTLSPAVHLGNEGGTIALVDAAGVKVHDVSYTAQQARRAGWTIVF
jgi:uncharacterized protein YukJ